MTLTNGGEGNGVTRKTNDSSIYNSGSIKKSGLNKNLKRYISLNKHGSLEQIY